MGIQEQLKKIDNQKSDFIEQFLNDIESWYFLVTSQSIEFNETARIAGLDAFLIVYNNRIHREFGDTFTHLIKGLENYVELLINQLKKVVSNEELFLTILNKEQHGCGEDHL